MTIEQLEKANEISYKLEKLRKCFNALILPQGAKIEFDTDDVICTYKSLRQAAKALGKSPSDISLCANGKLKTAYGYKWRFGNE